MLKYFFMMFFLIFFCLYKSKFWVVHNMMFLGSFVFIIMGVPMVGWGGLSYYFGSDVLSWGMVLLSFWICSLMLTASESIYKSNNYENMFVFNVLWLFLFLYLSFCSMNLFVYYIFFESSLIPTFLLIFGWGYQPERLQAGLYLLFYTLLASLPMLIGIFYLYSYGGVLMFLLLSEFDFGYLLFYLVMIMAFLVKMPMFLTHLWLPKAHVEAPISGSMILAGVLLKLGGYGLLRVYMFLTTLGMKLNYIWVSISLMGGVMVSLVCLRQIDLKMLIAYSSVVHMGVVLAGLLTMDYVGTCGAYSLMIAHGLCSSGLFCLANISYERLGSRSLLVNRGLMGVMPSMTLWWFLLCAGNMAAPPTLNLLGEVNLINTLVGWSWVSMFSLVFISFFGAAYTLYLYSYTQHGSGFSGLYSFFDVTLREYLLIFLHWLPLNLFIMKSDYCMLWI